MGRFIPVIVTQPSLEEIVADIHYNIDQLPQARLGCYSQEAMTISTESRLVELIIEGIKKVINWFKGLFSAGAGKARTSAVKDTETKFKSAGKTSTDTGKTIPNKGVLTITASHRIIDTNLKRTFTAVKDSAENISQFTNAPAFKGVANKTASDFTNELKHAIRLLHVGTGTALSLPGGYRIKTTETDGLLTTEPVASSPYVGEIPFTASELCALAVITGNASVELEALGRGLTRMESEGKAIISKLQTASGEDVAQVARSWTAAQGSIGRIASRLAGSVDTWLVISNTYRAA